MFLIVLHISNICSQYNFFYFYKTNRHLLLKGPSFNYFFPQMFEYCLLLEEKQHVLKLTMRHIQKQIELSKES